MGMPTRLHGEMPSIIPSLYQIAFYIGQDGSNPVSDYIYGGTNEKDLVAIISVIQRLSLVGQELLNTSMAVRVENQIFQLRKGRHRIFYAEDKARRRFVLLCAFMKTTQKTPPEEIKKAEHNWDDYQRTGKCQILKLPTGQESSEVLPKQQNNGGKSKTSPTASKVLKKTQPAINVSVEKLDEWLSDFQDVENHNSQSEVEENLLVNNQVQAQGEDQLGAKVEAEAQAKTFKVPGEDFDQQSIDLPDTENRNPKSEIEATLNVNNHVQARGEDQLDIKDEAEPLIETSKVSGENVDKQLTDLQDEEESNHQSATDANLLANNRAQAIFNDQAQGEDQLGIRDEVEALAETLLLRDVEPPVAVGILGGWGSGKSFVMYLINQYVQATRAKSVKKGWADGDEKDPKVPSFVGHIYQINFNAWTYAKSNLWASLMDTIFSSLNRQMQLERLLAHKGFSLAGDPPSKEQIIANMLAGGDEFKKIYLDNVQIDQDKDLEPWRKNLVHWSHHLLKETLLWNIMRGQQVETLEKIRNTEEQLRQLKTRREQFEKERVLDGITAKNLDKTALRAYTQSLKSYMLAFLSDQLSNTAKDELKKQNVKTEDIQKFLDEAKGLWGGIKTIVTAFQRSKIYIIWTIIFLALTFALPYLWTTYASGFIQLRIAQVIAFLLTLLPTLVAILPWIKKSIDAGLEAKKILEGAYVTQQAKQAEEIANSTEMPLPQKISELQNDISQGSLAAYDALIGLLETQAEEQRQKIGPSAKYSNLLEFVQSRLDAAIYENQLGLMHQVRKDIDELTFSLVDNASEDIFPRGKPRVILYIDDLDRCPPARVVEMLEAVQLLLNTKLFIVILGLDTRYVTRALEKEYKEILQHEGDPSGLDYIEKIIQIPYRVRPIENDRLREFIENQMDIDVTKPLAKDVNNDPSNVTSLPTVNLNMEEPEPPEIELPAAVIQFKQEDLDDLAACCQKIMLTPRSIKRLVNVFKLMKIFWFRADNDASIVERDRSRAVKQAAMSLLALSSAYPEVMREVFVRLETLYRQGKEQTRLYTVLNGIKLPSGSAHELSWQLKKYKDDISRLKAMAGFKKEKFETLTLKKFELSTFNIVRSFSFVGDPFYWTDGEEEVHHSGVLEKKVPAP